MGRVIGFGDLLIRLAAPGYQRLIQATSLDVFYTGAEANTLAFLAWNGAEAALVSKLPNNMLGDCALANMRKYGIDTAYIARGGERIGTYYLEKGASQRPSRLVYDRKHTAFATASAEDFDWDAIFDGASHFHFTGITPALGGNLPQICLSACKKAKEKGLLVSCDLNYRSVLWTTEQAQRTMQELMRYVDVLIGNEEDAEKVLGVKPRNTDVSMGVLDKAGYEQVARELAERFRLQAVAFTLRKSRSASDNDWSGMLYADGETVFSKEYPIHLVDRVGGGDSFSAGIIYSMLHGFDRRHTVEFAVAASCLKQTMEQDFNLSYADEAEQLLRGNGSGRIQR